MNTGQNLRHSSPVRRCEEAFSSRSLQATSTAERGSERLYHSKPGATQSVPFESLLEQAYPIAIEPEELHHVSTPPAKDEDVAGVGLLFKRRLHLCRKSLKAATHVPYACRTPDPRARALLLHEKVDHPRRTSSTARIAAGLHDLPR